MCRIKDEFVQDFDRDIKGNTCQNRCKKEFSKRKYDRSSFKSPNFTIKKNKEENELQDIGNGESYRDTG